MQSDIKKIEIQLNKLCSQHDELMALLDIYDYIPNLKHLQQTNRSISNKINHFEQQIEELLETNSTVKIREDIHLKMKQEEFKSNMEVTEKQLSDLNAKIEQQKAVISQLEEGRSSGSKILEAKEKAKIKINSMMQELENEMGNQLAAQVVRLKEEKPYDQIECETAMERAVADENYNYQKIMHEVELQLLQMEPLPFTEYFQFSYHQLKEEILILNAKAQNLQISQNSSEISEEQRELFEIKVGIVKKMCEQLQYRVIALKRYAGEQLMFMYEEAHNKMKVNDIQKSVREKLRELQHLITVLKSSTHLQHDC